MIYRAIDPAQKAESATTICVAFGSGAFHLFVGKVVGREKFAALMTGEEGFVSFYQLFIAFFFFQIKEKEKNNFMLFFFFSSLFFFLVVVL